MKFSELVKKWENGWRGVAMDDKLRYFTFYGIVKHCGEMLSCLTTMGGDWIITQTDCAENVIPTTLTTAEMIAAIKPSDAYKRDNAKKHQCEFVVLDNDGRLMWKENKCTVCNEPEFLSAKWTLLPPSPKPVTFMEAVKAYSEGKNIRVKCGCIERSFTDSGTKGRLYEIKGDGQHYSVSAEQILNGTWTVEE